MPYQNIQSNAPLDNVMTYNRQLFADDRVSTQDKAKYYEIFYKRE
jgi:hypothetical protein